MEEVGLEARDSASTFQILLHRTLTITQATYFDAGLGACGHTDNNNVPLVALSTKIYNKKLCNQVSVLSRSVPATSQIAPQIVEIKYPKTGKTAKVPVRDACPGCDANHLGMSTFSFYPERQSLIDIQDLSPAVWNILGADEALGVIDIEFEGPK